MTRITNIQSLKERRRELRSKSTAIEKAFWNAVRGNKLGYKFRRQHSIGGYILDFYCPMKRLIIELDGKSHDSKIQKEYDMVRDKFFTDLEYKVLRFTNKEIKDELSEVLKKIQNY